MKWLLLLFFLIASVSAFACDTGPPPVALEFLQSKYVFWGQATSKVYAKDSLTYNVTFTIDKHFKKGYSNPQTLAFTFQAEGEITGSYSSCDFSVNLGQKWLIYAYEHNGDLTFGYFGSNTRPRKTLTDIPKHELDLLESGDQIDVSKITFERQSIGNIAYSKDYQLPVPKLSIDSVIVQLQKKHYEVSNPLHFENFIVKIDSLGNIIDLFIPDRGANLEHYQVYDLRYAMFQPLKVLTPFQQDLVHALNSIKRWEPARFMGRRVNSQVFFQVYSDKAGKLSVSEIN